jgi:hypothetical protein
MNMLPTTVTCGSKHYSLAENSIEVNGNQKQEEKRNAE